MGKHGRPGVAALTGALLLFAGAAPAAAQGVYDCSIDELSACIEGEGCAIQKGEQIKLARQISVDIDKGRVTSRSGDSNLGDVTAKSLEKQGNIVFFQGVDRSKALQHEAVGWTIFLDTESQELSGSVVDAEAVFVVFGRCEG